MVFAVTARLPGRYRDGISRGRTIPSFAILWTSVVRFMPERAAAPWGPASTTLVVRSASRMCARIASSSVVAIGNTGAVPRTTAQSRPVHIEDEDRSNVTPGQGGWLWSFGIRERLAMILWYRVAATLGRGGPVYLRS